MNKHIPSYDEYLNEAKKSFEQLAHELVEIAATYTDIDLSPNMNQAQRVESDDELGLFYYELLAELKEEISSSDLKKFETEAKSFLKKYGVKI